MISEEEIRQRLRESMSNRKLTHRGIAKRLFISECSVDYYCEGRRKLPVGFVASYADQYKVDLNWLILGKGEDNAKSN